MMRPLSGACFALLLGAAMTAAAQNCNSHIPLTRPDVRYTANGDGTVTDNVTGLMWKQCPEGTSTTTITCDTGSPTQFTWQAALQRTADVNAGSAGSNLGHTDWRLPDIRELKSLVESACYDPALNTHLFPASLISDPYNQTWSSSTYYGLGNRAWLAQLNTGIVGGGLISYNGFVFLVRTP